MAGINPKLLHVPKHQLDKMLGATLADNLRQQYGKRSARVIKGDSVRVMRGEYKGVEGKVDEIDTERGTLHIEGIQREKIKGGNVKVPIHASNVMITSLKMDDKYRSNKMSGGAKAKPAKPEPAAEKKAAKKEEKKESNE